MLCRRCTLLLWSNCTSSSLYILSRKESACAEISIGAVAEFSEKDVQQLMNDTSIVRNRAKIIAAVNNAKQFQTIKEDYGSFQRYLDSLDKSDNYSKVIKELGKKFNRI